MKDEKMIQRNTDNFTGFIIQDKEKVYFHAQDKIFYFISKGAGIVAGLMKQDFKSSDHFLHGYQLALYTAWRGQAPGRKNKQILKYL